MKITGCAVIIILCTHIKQPVPDRKIVIIEYVFDSIKEVHLCTTRYDYISDWTAAAVSLQSDYIKYIVYVQVLIVYYIASVNLQYYSNKGNPTLP